ncbi:MAG TPA: 50S ribosomal protein L22 [Kiritimatiellia bacterium]|nr:50S ribosomal protein L22 [Kiritimatiellia bacterium]
MDVTAVTKDVRISPTKVRDLAREIQGRSVSDALKVTTLSRRKGALHLGKTLKSAIANAENNHDLSADDLLIKSAVVDEGHTLKRFRPKARGSAGRIIKRSSHIRIVLTDEKSKAR